MIKYYKKAVIENYANFSGRSSRSEYWYFVLMNIIVAISVAIVDNLLGLNSVLYLIHCLALLVPGLSALVRRLHDVGKSGWFFFIMFIPLVGPFWLLAVMCDASEEGNNQYGSNPHEPENELDLLGTE